MSLRTWSLSRSCALSGVIPRAGCRLVCRVNRGPSASVPRSRCRLTVQANELNKWCVKIISLNHSLHVEMVLVVLLYNWLNKTLAFRAGLGGHLTINATQIHSTSKQKLNFFVVYCIAPL